MKYPCVEGIEDVQVREAGLACQNTFWLTSAHASVLEQNPEMNGAPEEVPLDEAVWAIDEMFGRSHGNVGKTAIERFDVDRRKARHPAA